LAITVTKASGGLTCLTLFMNFSLGFNLVFLLKPESLNEESHD